MKLRRSGADIEDVSSPRLRRLPPLALATAVALGAGVATAVTMPPRPGERPADLVPIPGPTGPVEPTGGPGQGADPEANDHGQEVSAVAHDGSLHGCEKGAAVSEVASSKAGDHRQNQAKPHPCEGGATGSRGPGAGHGHAYGHDKVHGSAHDRGEAGSGGKGHGADGDDGSGGDAVGGGNGAGHAGGPGGAGQGPPGDQ